MSHEIVCNKKEQNGDKSRRVTKTMCVISQYDLCECEVWKLIHPSHNIILRAWPEWDSCEYKQYCR